MDYENVKDNNAGVDKDGKDESKCITKEFQADDFPSHVWELILCRLPIRSLFRMRSICRAWKSIVDSKSFRTFHSEVNRRYMFLLLFADYHDKTVVAYDSREDTWVVIPLSFVSPCNSEECSSICRFVVSARDLLIAEGSRQGTFIACNIFTKSHKCLPPLLPLRSTYVISMYVNPANSSEFKLLAVTTSDTLTAQVYDSVTNSWRTSGSFNGRFALLDTAVYLDGVFYCLSRGPDCLLAFDLCAGSWRLVDERLPCIQFAHLFEYEGSLILVGAIEEFGMVEGIGLWKFDADIKKWHKLCEMPGHFFCKLRHENHYFQLYAVGYGARLCFYRTRAPAIFMYDLRQNRWWTLPSCAYHIRVCLPTWVGLALEPRLDTFV